MDEEEEGDTEEKENLEEWGLGCKGAYKHCERRRRNSE